MNFEIDDGSVRRDLIFLAGIFSMTFDFNYVTIQYSEGMKSPIVQLWKSRPQWTKKYEDYGDVYEGWLSNELINWNVTFSVECLKGDYVLKNLGKEFNYKDYLITKEDIKDSHIGVYINK